MKLDTDFSSTSYVQFTKVIWYLVSWSYTKRCIARVMGVTFLISDTYIDVNNCKLFSD